MACYTIANATTAYNYPNLNCTPGNPVPNATNTIRDTFILIDGQWYNTVRTNTSVSNNTQLVVAELPLPYQDMPVRDLILPAVILMICLFNLILNMIKGVRR